MFLNLLTGELKIYQNPVASSNFYCLATISTLPLFYEAVLSITYQTERVELYVKFGQEMGDKSPVCLKRKLVLLKSNRESMRSIKSTKQKPL